MLIEEKYDELCGYIYRLAMGWHAPPSSINDIQHNVLERLLIEQNAKGEFTDSSKLFGRATNIAREEIAKAFAGRLPVSGVGFQAHWTARKALMSADNNPDKAYEMQSGTSRVSRELIQHVAGGTGLSTDPHAVAMRVGFGAAVERTWSDQHIEDNVRVALSTLDERGREIVRMKIWQNMTYAAIAEELGIKDRARIRKLFNRAINSLKDELKGAFPEYGDEN